MSAETSAAKKLDIPKYYYFESGNDYSGSKGDFSYKIAGGEKFKAMTWHGRLCSAKAAIEHEQEFDRSPEGFQAMMDWLDERSGE